MLHIEDFIYSPLCLPSSQYLYSYLTTTKGETFGCWLTSNKLDFLNHNRTICFDFVSICGTIILASKASPKLIVHCFEISALGLVEPPY